MTGKFDPSKMQCTFVQLASNQLEHKLWAEHCIPKGQPIYIGVDGSCGKDSTVVISTIICQKCGRSVQSSYLKKHWDGRECQLLTAIEEMKLQGYHAVKRQQLPILKDFGVVYRERDYTETIRTPYDIQKRATEPMPYVFVHGWLGVICKKLVSRPLRWVLQEMRHNYDFRAAIESLVLIGESDEAPLEFVVEAWNSRKGKHKNASVRAFRSASVFNV